MKRLIFLFIASLMAHYSALTETISQHIVEEGKVWHYKASKPDVSPEYYEEWNDTYSLEGDTIIDSHQCLKLYYTSDCPYDSYNHSYHGALFEEGEKVYYIAAGSASPALLYDFSCEPGTTIQVSNHKLVINERKLVKYRNEYLTVIKWSPIENDIVYDDICFYWIEGIGSEIDLMNETPVWWDGCLWKELVKCKLNGQTIFDYDEYWKTSQIVTSINEVFPALQAKSECFDLQGRKVSNPREGIYIKDRKKVLIK